MLKELRELTGSNRVVRIEGPNGSGKSTLLAQYQLELREAGTGFGIYSQHDEPFEELTPKEVFAIAGRPRAISLAESLGLGEALERPLGQLSSGERAKALIALALQFDLVLLDEPLSHLDPKTREQLQEIVKESSASFVIVNHEVGAFEYAPVITLESFESR